MSVDTLKKSLSLSFLDKYVGYVLRFVATLFIARLCTPHDIGIFSVAFVMISIGHVLRDFGVAQYLIHEKEINSTKIRASLTLMWGIAWGLCLALWFSKGWISRFYGEPELEQAIEVLSLIYLLAPFGSIRIALLRRDMDFSKLARINIFSYVSLHVVTVYMAWVGFGYQALVWGQVAGVVATLSGTIFYSPKGCWHWPGFKGIKDVYRFGLPLCMANILETASDGGADLILGKTMSMTAVGLFGKAQGLLNLFKVAVTSAVWPVVLPYFSIKNREGEDLLPDYLKAIEIYTLFAWPFFLGLAIFAHPFVLVLFGDQWLAIIPLVRVLSFVAIIQSIFPFYNALLVAKGRVGLNFKLQGGFAVLRVSAVAMGAFYSMMHVAILLVAAECIAFCILYGALSKAFSLKLGSLVKSLSHAFKNTAFIALFFVPLQWGVSQIELVASVHLLISIALGLVVWVCYLKVTHHNLYLMIETPIKNYLLRSKRLES